MSAGGAVHNVLKARQISRQAARPGCSSSSSPSFKTSATATCSRSSCLNLVNLATSPNFASALVAAAAATSTMRARPTAKTWKDAQNLFPPFCPMYSLAL
eukprot:2348581-Amphidinium_carterae.1